MGRPLVLVLTGGVLLSGAAEPLVAQGFGLYEHGSCFMARAGTGVAAPCDDGSAAYLNPAGLLGRSGWTFSGGVTFISASGSFTNDTTGIETDLANRPIPIPHAYISYGIDDRWAAGLGLFIPYGLGTTWPRTFEGRFVGYDNNLRSFYVQPTLSFRPHPLVAVGAGIDIAIGTIAVHQRLDFFEQPVPGAPPGTIGGQLGIPRNTEIIDAELTASGATGVGAHLGILLEPSRHVSFGARYLTRITLDYDGTANFRQITTNLILPADNPLAPGVGPVPLDNIIAALMQPGGPFANQGARTRITMPDQFIAGVAVKPGPTLTLLADWQWVHWAVFDTVAFQLANAPQPSLHIQNYRNTNGVRLGVDWRPVERWAFRGGVLAHSEASPPETVTPLLPEHDRKEITIGFGVDLTKTLATNVAYQFVGQDERRGRMRDPLPGENPRTALNAGVYTFRGHLVGMTLTWKP